VPYIANTISNITPMSSAGARLSWRAANTQVAIVTAQISSIDNNALISSVSKISPNRSCSFGLFDLSGLFGLSRLFGCLVSLGQATKPTR
jgi:hypothetical protein